MMRAPVAAPAYVGHVGVRVDVRFRDRVSHMDGSNCACAMDGGKTGRRSGDARLHTATAVAIDHHHHRRRHHRLRHHRKQRRDVLAWARGHASHRVPVLYPFPFPFLFPRCPPASLPLSPSRSQSSLLHGDLAKAVWCYCDSRY